MAKKKKKKSILEKLKVRKKKDSKKKSSKKKDSKKKDSKKKSSKKKDSKKKESKKKDVKKKDTLAASPAPKPVAKTVRTPRPATKRIPVRKTVSAAKPAPKRAPATKAKPAAGSGDHSSNYKVNEAIAKLRTIKKRDELMAFIKGEKRVTVTKVIPAAMNRLRE